MKKGTTAAAPPADDLGGSYQHTLKRGCSHHCGYGCSGRSSTRVMHRTFMLGIRPGPGMAAPPLVTLTNCLTRAGISLPLRADEAESILAAFRSRAISFSRNQQNASTSWDDVQAISELSPCWQPLASFLRERDPFFKSACANLVRQRFWREASMLALGRSEASLMYRGACRKDSVMAGIEELLAHACEGSSYLVARIGHHTIVSKLREISN